MSFRRLRRSLSGMPGLSALGGSGLCGLGRSAVEAEDADESLFFVPWRPVRVRLALGEGVTLASAVLVPRVDAGYCVHLVYAGGAALACVADGPLWEGEALCLALPAGWCAESVEVHTKVCVPEAKGGRDALWSAAVAGGVVAARRPPCLLALTHMGFNAKDGACVTAAGAARR